MSLLNEEDHSEIGGASITNKENNFKRFPENKSKKRLLLLFIGLLITGGFTGGYLYLISKEEPFVPVMSPAVIKQLPVTSPPTQVTAATTDVLAVKESDDFAIPALPPETSQDKTVTAVKDTKEPFPLKESDDFTVPAMPPETSSDTKTASVDISTELPPMPDESFLVDTNSNKLKKTSVIDIPKIPKDPSNKKEGFADFVKNSQDTEPTPAELAIVQNAAMLDFLSPPSSVSIENLDEEADDAIYKGLMLTDILSQPADIRALPKKYLIVKKDHSANAASSHLTAARSALSQGHYPAALELFETLYKKKTWSESISMGRAVTLQKMGQTSPAISAYEEILEKNPKNIEALTNMLGLLNKQTPEEAIEKLLQLRKTSPFNADVTAQLGVIYGTVGDYEKALKYLEMANAIKPENSGILYNRAVVYDRMGKTTQAADIYRHLLLLARDKKLDQNFPVKTIRNRLSVIR